ncbi:unnamed protein product [Orchesella dallaii]|uniref:Uncharacterized protein n=1 Tax=Orchesella dallaii TaxID=48710 RepID=A0ABP1PI41_9HEXA
MPNNSTMDIADPYQNASDIESGQSFANGNPIDGSPVTELTNNEKTLLLAMTSNMERLLKQPKKQIDDLHKLLQEQSKQNKHRFEGIEKENKDLKSKLSSLQRENESLQVELREKNIIVTGLKDSENESELQLFNSVCELLNSITDKCDNPSIKVRPDKVYRINKFNIERIRPVRVKFSTISARDHIFRNRDKVLSPCVLKADIPFSMRRDHAILKQKEAELIDNGEPCTINMKKRQLETNGETFEVIDGQLENSVTVANRFPSPNVTNPPNKRLRNGRGVVGNFLGKASTQGNTPQTSRQASGRARNQQSNM